jgi:hypothetical protein
MKKTNKETSMKTKTSIVLFAGLLMACAGVVAPGAAHANPGSMCLTLGAGLNQDPVTSGHLQVVGVQKLFSKGERWQHGNPTGAAIKVLPTPGMTMADLQRAATCHAGKQDAQSPLAVEGVKIHVTREGSAYVLRLTADSRSAALEIQRRAEAAAQR